MRILNAIYSDQDSFRNFVDTHELLMLPNILVQVFSGILDPKKIQAVLRHVKDSLPHATLIGTSTTGEIAHGKSLYKTILISITVFENTAIKSLVLHEEEARIISPEIWNPILSKDTKAVIVFSSGFTLDHGAIIRSIPNREKQFVVAGGIAGDNNKLQKTWVFHDSKIVEIGAVAVSLSSSVLSAKGFMKFNWKPIGKYLEITHAEGNIIREIDGKSVSAVYQKYLGEVVAQNLPSTASLFPLVSYKGGILISRVMLQSLSDGAGVFTGSYQTGEFVQLAYADYDMLIDNSIVDTFDANQVEGFFIYSCGGRKSILSNKIEQEMLPWEAYAATSGFFTYGEFFTSEQGTNEILNNTMTILALSESATISSSNSLLSAQRQEKQSFEFSPQEMYQSLAYFTSVVTQELLEAKQQVEERNHELQRLAITDNLTQLYNRAKLEEVLEHERNRMERFGRSFCILLVDVDHFKAVNDTYGHQVGDQVLVAIAMLLKSSTRQVDVAGRWGGEEFLIVCPETDLHGGMLLADRIRLAVAEFVFPLIKHKTISVGGTVFSSGDSIKEAVARADQALYQSKESGRNRVTFKN